MRIFTYLTVIVLGSSAAIAGSTGEIQNDTENASTSNSRFLSKMAAGEVFGACVYLSNGVQQCKQTIQSDCTNTYQGIWIQGGQCPATK
jgi:hypothetical protein